MELRNVIQHVIAARSDLADLAAMNLVYVWDADHASVGKRPSYGRVDPDANPYAVTHVARTCNVSPEDARAILDVWNVLAFGYDEGYANGSGENDPVTETDLTQYDIHVPSQPDESRPYVFSHRFLHVEDEDWCGICGDELDDGSIPDQHSDPVYTTKEA